MKSILFILLSTLFISTLVAGPSFPQQSDVPKKSKFYTSAKTAPFKDCSNKKLYKDIFSCFTKGEEANHAFMLLQRNSKGIPIKTKYVALLHHGLSDSPYFYRDIAMAIYKLGHNVVAPRWSGMGSKPEDLYFTHRKEWYEDVRFSKQIALNYGTKIIYGGMSLGGTLIVRESVLNPDKNVAGALFFSPAIGLEPRIRKTCLPIIQALYGAKKTYGQDVRYPKISHSGTCELTRVVDDLLEEKLDLDYKPEVVSKFDNGLNLDLHKLYEDIDFPIFNVITAWDTAIDFEMTLGLSTHSKSNELGKSTLYYYYNPTDPTHQAPELPKKVIRFKAPNELKHASVLLRNDRLLTAPEFNPFFDEMEKKLVEFVKVNFPI
jgi:hypothetical protein